MLSLARPILSLPWPLIGSLLYLAEEAWKWQIVISFKCSHISIMANEILKILDHLTQERMLHMMEGWQNIEVRSMVTGTRLLGSNPSAITKQTDRIVFNSLCFTFCLYKMGTY